MTHISPSYRSDTRDISGGVGSVRPPGRTRIRLAKLLSDRLGYEIRPEDIWEQSGVYRTNKMYDALVWGVGTTIGSWDTMGTCVRNGFDVSKRHGLFKTASGCPIQIDAKSR